MNDGDILAMVAAIAIVGAIVYLAIEIRSLHDDLIPIIESPIVQGAAGLGT